MQALKGENKSKKRAVTVRFLLLPLIRASKFRVAQPGLKIFIDV
jgi:hypothetical protein